MLVHSVLNSKKESLVETCSSTVPWKQHDGVAVVAKAALLRPLCEAARSLHLWHRRRHAVHCQPSLHAVSFVSSGALLARLSPLWKAHVACARLLSRAPSIFLGGFSLTGSLAFNPAFPPAKPMTAPSFIDEWRQPYRPGPLTESEVALYWSEGFVVKHDLIPHTRLEGVKNAIDRMVDGLASRLHKAGKIANRCSEAGIEDRLTQLEAQFTGASVLLHKQGILQPEIAALWGSPELLDVAKQLLGDDVGGHPVWNLRCKTPHNEEATVPWHQDNAYLDSESWQCLQVTAWVPLLDATRRNGCLQVLRKGHASGKTAKHTCCVGGTWYVAMEEEGTLQALGIDLVRDCETCEVPYGSVLLLNNLIPHRSLNNLSNEIRWSLDLRFQRPSEPNGFYGLKPCIRLAKKGEPDFMPDWTSWAGIDRNAIQAEAVSESKRAEVGVESEEGKDGFDTTIYGPWFNNWAIVHHNRHTAAHSAAREARSESWTFA